MADGEVIGVASLAQKFKAMSLDAERVGRLMVVSGGRIIRDEAKAIHRQNGSVRTGATINNIVIKRDKRAPKGTIEYVVGVRHGRNLTKKQKANSSLAVSGSRIVKRYENDPWYWFMVEYTGAKPHHLGKGSYLARKNRSQKAKGRMHPGFKPKPFIKPSLERKRNEALRAMEVRLDKEIAKANK